VINFKSLKFDVLLYVCNRIVNHLPFHLVRELFYRRVMGFEIGRTSAILMGSWFDGRNNLTIGNHVVINQNCRIDNRGGISIGENVSISPEVHLLTADHIINSPTFEGRTRPIVIEDFVFIGSRATVLPGVTLGRGAVVAACAVVTKDVAPYSIVAGVPAEPIGARTESLHYTLEYRRFLF
tara:strand:- start:88742 stop:89284 length:543 start_codon:yes stop_codon:yes gene_type:complete